MKDKNFLLLLFFYFGQVLFSAPVIYQAENGILNGTYIANSRQGYQGSGYVEGFDNPGDYCEVTVNVPSAGMYNITIGFASPFGPKINDLYVNNIFQANISFFQTSSFTWVSAGMVPLNAGNNTLKIQHNWGWFCLDWFGVEIATLPSLSISKNLVNQNSTDATKCLMNYLVDNFGNKTIAGQSGISNSSWIYNNTGKYPALCGFDMMDYSPSRVERGATSQEVERAITWYQQGGIVQFQWHWNAPNCLYDSGDCPWWRGFYTNCTCFDIQYAMNNPTSNEYQLIIRDLDAIANQLKRLRDAGVPVLWRPLHEAEGGWFWWGAKGPEPCKQLYYLMFDRFKNYHNLNNLIWVWTSTTSSDALNWYPGNNYVDVIGADIYLSGGNYSPSTNMFYGLFSITGNQKLVAMTENGTIPDPDAMINQHAHWSWFMTWNGFESDQQQNSLSHVQYVYNHSYIITRDELNNVFNCQIIQTVTFTPSQTVIPTFTATRTFTSTTTRTNTMTATQTQTMTTTKTNTNTLTLTRTNTQTETQTYTMTMTKTNTETQTATRTSTKTPTMTNTPTASLTNTATKTNTQTATKTNTFTNTATQTNTETKTMTNTGTETNTITSTATGTATRTSTNTLTHTETNTAAAIGTYTTQITDTPTATESRTKTNTSTPTQTFTQTFSQTETGTMSFTTSFTNTYTPTLTKTEIISTATQTNTLTGTETATGTNTQTPTINITQVIPTYTKTPVNLETEEKIDYIIYPNPLNPEKEDLIIKIYNINNKIYKYIIKIYTRAYRLIYKKENFSDDNIIKIDKMELNNISDGIYYFIIETDNLKNERKIKIFIVKR